MVLGTIWCPANLSGDIFIRIRDIKKKHGIPSNYEIKWNRISPAKVDFYSDLIDFFFDDDDLHFRALVVDKSQINKVENGQTHDEFYYKMYFTLLKEIFDPKFSYNIYIDKKDTKSRQKIIELEEILRNNQYDYSKRIIKKIQEVKAREVELVQLTDLIIGSIAYLYNGYTTSEAKLSLIERIKYRSKYSLLKSTLPRETKFNISKWLDKASETQ